MHLGLIVVAVIFLALTIYFAISYFSAVGNKNNVNHSIQQKQQQISSFGGLQNIAALQSQLEQAQQDLANKSPFPKTIDNTEVAYSIIQAARDSGITCFQYAPQSNASTSVNGSVYTGNTYQISASGVGDVAGYKISKIANFLADLEDAYNTSSMNDISLSNQGGSGLWTISFVYSILSIQ